MIFTVPFTDFFTIFNNMIFDSSKTKGFDVSVVMYELELAINRALYVFCAV